MVVGGIIVAAGRGERTGRPQPKQFERLLGRPMLSWSAAAMDEVCDRLVVVAEPSRALDAALGGLAPVRTPGGKQRTQSVRAGLEALAAEAPDIVLIHDAARPGLTPALAERVIDALGSAQAAAPALPLRDAVKRGDHEGRVVEDVARDALFRVQTPQGFHFAPLLAAYRALPADVAFEDDIAVARQAGMEVRLVAGDERLMKVTVAEDFDLAERLLAPGSGVPLVGQGFDAHQFGPGDHVVLCGIKVPHDHGLIGHSDSDAGWHALTDAILGAVGAGDIGQHFPPSDARWKGASSAIFLKRAVEIAAEAGARVVNADITIVCEAPRIGPHREAMRASTAALLGVEPRRVNVKGTTTETMGFTGRREGLAAQASVLLLGS